MHPVAVLPLVMAATLVGGLATASPAATSAAPATSRQVQARADEPCGWRVAAPHRYDHVVWIVLENHSYDELIGLPGSAARSSSPYLNEIAEACGLATDFWGITHPSLPNYLAMVSGSTGGVARSCPPRDCPQRRRTVFQQLRESGRAWRIFAESMPSTCLRRDAYPYVVRHNPAPYFPDTVRCGRWDRPMGTPTAGPLMRAVRHGWLPALSLVIPDQCSNTHDCPIETGDTWLSQVVPRILNGPDYAEGRMAVVITYDEGAGGYPGQNCRRDPDESCHIVTAVISPSTKPGTRVARRFDHYSLLETTQRMLGLRLLRHAADERTRSMRQAFDL